MALQTATNPQTGERVALIDGQWVPITKTASNPSTGEKVGLINNQWMPLPLSAGIGRTAPQAQAGEDPEDQSILREVADVPLKIAGGAVTGVRMVADAFGAGSDLSKTLRGAEDYVAALYSAQSKQDSQEIASIMKDAEDKGVVDQVLAAVKAFSVAPVDTIANALGTAAPAVAAGIATTLGAAPVVVGTGVGLGVGALMGAGTVKSAIYEATKEVLTEQASHLSPEQIETAAVRAQEYDGENLDQILIGAGVGAIAARTGAEPQLIRQIAKGISTRAAQKEAVTKAGEQTTKAAAERGAVKQAGVTAAKEFATESVQGGQEQLAGNLAQRRQGFDTPLMQGVAGQGALEGLAGAGMGAVSGAVEGRSATADARADEPALTPVPPNAPENFPESAPGVVRQTLSEEEKQVRIRQVSDDLQTQTGMLGEDALTLATQRVEEELALKENQTPKVEADSREQELTVEFLDAGFPIAEAVSKAKAQVTEETQADAQNQDGGTAGDVDAEQQSVGAGVPVASELPVSRSAALEGTTNAEPSGVVSTGQDVGTVAGGTPDADPSVGDIANQTAAAVEQELAPTTEAVTKVDTPAQEATPASDVISLGDPVDLTANTPDVAAGEMSPGSTATTTIERDGEATTTKTKAAPKEAKPEITLDEELDAAFATPESQAAVTASVEKLVSKRGGKRAGSGRTPAALTPEERAAKKEATSKSKGPMNASRRAVADAEADIKAVTDTSGLEGMEGAELQREVSLRMDKLQKAVNFLYRIKQSNRGDTYGKRATAALANDNISPKMLAEAKRAFELVDLKVKIAKDEGVDVSTARAGERSTGVAPVNSKIGEAKNAQQLLTVIAGHSKFFKFLAGRLRPFVADVKVVVIETDSAIPTQLQRHMDSWNQADGSPRAVGMMVSNKGNERTIYLRGDSFGAAQGVNVVTALHEVLHAALDLKIKTGINAAVKGLEVDRGTEQFLDNVYELMELAEDAFVEMYSNGTAPPALVQLMRSSARKDADGNVEFQMFKDPYEFLAYGLSDNVMQGFLKRLPGLDDSRNAFTKFVDAIRRVLGLESGQTNALLGLIDVADRVLMARQTAEMKEAYKNKDTEDSPSLQEIERTQKEIDKGVTVAVNKTGKSRKSRETAEQSAALQLLRDPRKSADAFVEILRGLNLKRKSLVLNVFTNDALAEVSRKAGLSSVGKATSLIQDMHGMTGRLIEAATGVVGNIHRAFTRDPALREKLEDIVHVATIANIDPAVDKRSKKLNEMWIALGEDGQRQYTRLRDYYANMSELYSKLLDDQVNNLSLGAAEKANLLSKIKVMYETGSKIKPYFPLNRRGEYAVGLGTGNNREFYMFESRAEQQALIKAIAKERGVSVAELKQSDDISIINGASTLRNNAAPSGSELRAMFDLIDATDFSQAPIDTKDSLKEAVYQMYLASMPQQNLRKQFLNRKNITGFDTDILRNLAQTASNHAYQLARVKYVPQIRLAAKEARNNSKNNEDLFAFVDELDKRVKLEVEATNTRGGLLESIATIANRAAYIHFLSGASSALLQPMQLVTVGFNVLGARHGYAKATVEIMKMMKVFNEFGVTKKNDDGSISYVMPSIRYSKNMSINEEERRALFDMLGTGVADETLNNEIVSRKDMPTDEFGTKTQRAKRAALILTTGLMHSTERMSREVMLLASYRLSRNAGKSVAEAKTQAIADTYEGVGNMSASNRPPIMRNPLGKVSLQFMMFPLYMASFLVKNFRNMLPLMNKEGKAEASKMFFGTLGCTFALTGAVGMPLFSMVMGMVGWAMNNLSDDDEYPETLKSMDFETWWRKVWLPEAMGHQTIGGYKLSDIIERGPANALTGVDLSSRLSLNDMFVRDRKETRTTKEGAIEMAMGATGPFGAQIMSYADGYDALTQGDYQKAIEKFSPALLRNLALASKFAEEGAKDFRGAELIARGDYTTGQMIGQVIGFRSDKLANMQGLGFKLSGLEQRINFKRTEVMNIADRVFRNGDQDGIDKALEKVIDFNQRYPAYAITGENLMDSLMKRATQRAMSKTGVIQSEKNLSIPGFAEAMQAVE